MKISQGRPDQGTLIHHSLILEKVVLPEHPPSWPLPLSLALGLKEFLVLEGLNIPEAKALLSLAASLQVPAQGRVFHWGQDVTTRARANLYGLRRRIAYISPDQVLLHRRSVQENIALVACYYQGRTVSQVVRDHRELLEYLHLVPYLSKFPAEISEEILFRVLWARELIKEPELILAVPLGPRSTPESTRLILGLLGEYRQHRRGAVLLTGASLDAAQPLADRLVRLHSGQLTERRFPGPATTYLSLL